MRRIVAALSGLGLLACALAQGAEMAPAEANIGGLAAKFIDAGGVRTRYYDEGSGEPMVLVHGTGSAAWPAPTPGR